MDTAPPVDINELVESNTIQSKSSFEYHSTYLSEGKLLSVVAFSVHHPDGPSSILFWESSSQK